MAKFKVFFSGYLKELYGQLGMSMNQLIRQCVGGTAKIRSSYIQEAESVDVEILKKGILGQIARLRFADPKQSGSLEFMLKKTFEEFSPVVDDWVQRNKELIAEIQFLGEPDKVERES